MGRAKVACVAVRAVGRTTGLLKIHGGVSVMELSNCAVAARPVSLVLSEAPLEAAVAVPAVNTAKTITVPAKKILRGPNRSCLPVFSLRLFMNGSLSLDSRRPDVMARFTHLRAHSKAELL